MSQIIRKPPKRNSLSTFNECPVRGLNQLVHILNNQLNTNVLISLCTVQADLNFCFACVLSSACTFHMLRPMP